MVDMKSYWAAIDQEIQAQPMPEEFANTMCSFLCNDCGTKGQVKFHFCGIKCSNQQCGSFNTKTLETTGFPDQQTLMAMRLRQLASAVVEGSSDHEPMNENNNEENDSEAVESESESEEEEEDEEEDE
jgi:hypothetical protein